MRNFKTLLILLFFSLVLTACSEEQKNVQEDISEGNQEVAEEESQWQSKPGDVMETEGGKFTLHSRNHQLEILEHGPLSIDIPQVATLTGELYDEFKEYVGEDVIEYVQVDMQLINSSEMELIFPMEDITLLTSTGEQLSPSQKLSVIVDSNFVGEETKQGSLFFLIEKGSVQDLEWVELNFPTVQDIEGKENEEETKLKVQL